MIKRCLVVVLFLGLAWAQIRIALATASFLYMKCAPVWMERLDDLNRGLAERSLLTLSDSTFLMVIGWMMGCVLLCTPFVALRYTLPFTYGRLFTWFNVPRETKANAA